MAVFEKRQLSSSAVFQSAMAAPSNAEEVPSPPSVGETDFEDQEAEILEVNEGILSSASAAAAASILPSCCKSGCLHSLSENTRLKAMMSQLQQAIMEAPPDKQKEFRFDVLRQWLVNEESDSHRGTQHRELHAWGGLPMCQAAASHALKCSVRTVRDLIKWIKDGNENPPVDGRIMKIQGESKEMMAADLMLAWALRQGLQTV